MVSNKQNFWAASAGTEVKQLILILSPQGDSGAPLKALLFDSWYDHYRGVICLVAILDGSLKKGKDGMTVHQQH